MREESHLDDMRSAIRGDFERLAERRGGQELMRGPEPEPEPEPAPAELELGLEHKEPPEEMQAEPEDAPPAEPPRRSLLDRLLGR